MAGIFRRIEWCADKVVIATAAIGIGSLVLLAGFIFIQVFARYVLKTHMPGMFAYAVGCLIIFPFLTATYTLSKGQHVSVDLLTSRFSERANIGLEVVAYLTSLAFTITLGWHSARWAYFSFANGITAESEGIPIPLGVLICVISLSSFLLTVQLIRMAVHRIHVLLSNKEHDPTSSKRLLDNPLLFASLFIIAIIICMRLVAHGHPIVALSFTTLVFLFSGMPIFLALGVSGTIGLYFLVGHSSLVQMPITAFQAVNKFPLSALPLFVLGGLIMEQGKMIDDVYYFLKLFSGRFAESSLLVTIALGAFFCAVSGSSVGATAAVAAAVLPVLIREGYKKSLCCGLVAASTMGTVLPPSNGAIVYGVITEESIAGLFMGLMGPAVMLFGSFSLYIILLSTFNRKALFEKGHVLQQFSYKRVPWKDKLIALKNAVWGLFTPIFVLGGIYLGIFTPTEAAAVMLIYSIIVCMFIRKTLKWRDLLRGIARGAHISTMIICIIITALILGLSISQLQITPAMVALAEGTGLGAIGLLAIIFCVIFILGMFLPAGAILVITVPIFFPAVEAAGISGLWLGVFYIIVLEIGLLTPPVGLNLFAIRGVSGIPLNIIIKGCLPFLAMMLLTVALMYLFPQIITWLPSTIIR